MLLAVSLLVACAGVLEAMASKPNIVVVHVDSLDGRVLTDWDGPARMPNLRAFAREGVTFLNAYSAAPECVVRVGLDRVGRGG